MSSSKKPPPSSHPHLLLHVHPLLLVVLPIFIDIFFCQANAVFNVALNKPTNQSTTHDPGVSSRAVDGDRNTNFSEGQSCSHTHYGDPAWWMVDVGAVVSIEAVSLWNSQGQPERLTNFTIEVSRELPATLAGFPGPTTDSQVCASVDENTVMSATEEEYFSCQEIIEGRYVRIVKYHEKKWKRSLILCEVEVYSDIKTASFVGVPSQISCSALCLGTTAFTCTGALYDQSTGTCQLLEVESHVVEASFSGTWESYDVVQSNQTFSTAEHTKSMTFKIV